MNAATDILIRKYSYSARFWDAQFGKRYSWSCAHLSACFISNSECEACWNRKLLPLHRASPANYHIEIRFRRSHGDSVKGFLLVAVIIHEESQAGTCGYHYGSRMQDTYLAKNNFIFISWVMFSVIILEPHVDQLVISTPLQPDSLMTMQLCHHHWDEENLRQTASLSAILTISYLAG